MMIIKLKLLLHQKKFTKKNLQDNNMSESFLEKYMNEPLEAAYIDRGNEQIINNDIHDDYIDPENGIINREEFFERF